MGMDLADNSLRLNGNQKIFLEKFNTVFVWFNSATGKVEIVRDGRVMASW